MDWFAFFGALFILIPSAAIHNCWGKDNHPFLKCVLTGFFLSVFALFMSMPEFSFNLLGRIVVATFTMKYDLIPF